MARRGAMQGVELLDAEQPADDAPVEARRRHPRRWLVGAGLAVVLAAAITQGVVTARENSALARLARVPGVLSPVGPTLAVTQRVAPDDSAALFGGVSGSLTRAPDGSQAYTWVGSSEESAGWTAPLLGPDAGLANVAEGDVIGGSTCQGDNPPGTSESTARRVVCLVTDGGTLLGPAGATALVRTTHREIVALSTDDGAVLARWPLGAAEGLVVRPSGLVVVASGADDGSTVTGYDLLTGTVRWSRTDAFPPGFDYDPGSSIVSVFTMGAFIGYNAPGSGTTLLDDLGNVVREVPTTARVSDWTGAGWSFASGSQVRIELTTPSGRARTSFLAPNGDPAQDLTVDGRVVTVSVDDGSVPGLVLTFDTTTHAWDATTGKPRWSADVVTPEGALVVRGRVYLVSRVGVIALDGSTGRQLWASSPDAGQPTSLMTDGRHVLVAVDGATRAGSALIAYDPVSGHEELRVGLPAGIDRVSPFGRELVGTDRATGEYVVLG